MSTSKTEKQLNRHFRPLSEIFLYLQPGDVIRVSVAIPSSEPDQPPRYAHYLSTVTSCDKTGALSGIGRERTAVHFRPPLSRELRIENPQAEEAVYRYALTGYFLQKAIVDDFSKVKRVA